MATVLSALDHACALHRTQWVIDGHADTFYEVMAKGYDFFAGRPDGHTDYPRFLKGGVDLQIASIWTPPAFMGSDAADFALKLLWHGLTTIEHSEGRLVHVKSKADLDRIGPGSGKLGFMFSLEGAAPLRGSVELLEMFFRLGVRAVGLTWNHSNECARGCYGKDWMLPGLTTEGKRIVRRMEALGMLVDVAHLHDEAFEDLLGIITKPIIASHTSCRAVRDIPRNITDAQVQAVAASGGVVGVTFIAEHLRTPNEFNRSPGCTVQNIADQVVRIVELVGPEHVGIGSDFDGYETPIEGLEDVSHLPNLTATLIERGFTDEMLIAFLGGNFRRVLQKVLPD